ncbi:hypothetical protein LJC48_01100 [Desulfovibrio sp. OttesenSCG-928-C06]|nr:hypothetical protein [Desulfovibrio sp. OttesenSCG-928-C06]
MNISCDVNQLSDKPQDASRLTDLRVWMIRNNMSYGDIARSFGVSRSAVQAMVSRPRISSQRHQQLRELGIPEHLLPPVVDVPRGRPARMSESMNL